MDASSSHRLVRRSKPLEVCADEWLRAARDGSQSALGMLLDAHRQYLLLVANRSLDDKLRSKVGASDVVQDTYVEAQRDFVKFRGSTGEEFHAWLIGILAHRLANNVRRFKQTKQRDVNREVGGEAGEAAIQRHQPDAITPGTAFVVDEERRRVRLAVQKLDEPGRSVLVARIWQGQSFVDIGAELGYSADATRKIWSRAVRRLSKLLSQVE